MSSVAIVSDSTAAIPSDYAAKHGVRVVPLYLKIGDDMYRDGIDLTAAEFYERLPHCNPLPTTSQPSAGDFLGVYRDVAASGATAIISIHLSSGISGTVSSAHAAAEQMSGFPIEIVDTQCAAGSHLFAVEAGVAALEQGKDLAQTVAVMRHVLAQQKIVFSVDTLEYLYKGGRIGGAAALLGSLLQFRPLLHFRDGKIDALERVRKSSKALVRMVEVMAEWLGSNVPCEVYLMHAACPDRAQALADLLPQYMQVANMRTDILTPVLGAHVGVGTIGICACPRSAFAL